MLKSEQELMVCKKSMVKCLQFNLGYKYTFAKNHMYPKKCYSYEDKIKYICGENSEDPIRVTRRDNNMHFLVDMRPIIGEFREDKPFNDQLREGYYYFVNRVEMEEKKIDRAMEYRKQLLSLLSSPRYIYNFLGFYRANQKNYKSLYAKLILSKGVYMYIPYFQGRDIYIDSVEKGREKLKPDNRYDGFSIKEIETIMHEYTTKQLTFEDYITVPEDPFIIYDKQLVLEYAFLYGLALVFSKDNNLYFNHSGQIIQLDIENSLRLEWERIQDFRKEEEQIIESNKDAFWKFYTLTDEALADPIPEYLF